MFHVPANYLFRKFLQCFIISHTLDFIRQIILGEKSRSQNYYRPYLVASRYFNLYDNSRSSQTYRAVDFSQIPLRIGQTLRLEYTRMDLSIHRCKSRFNRKRNNYRVIALQ